MLDTLKVSLSIIPRIPFMEDPFSFLFVLL